MNSKYNLYSQRHLFIINSNYNIVYIFKLFFLMHKLKYCIQFFIYYQNNNILIHTHVCVYIHICIRGVSSENNSYFKNVRILNLGHTIIYKW